MTPRDRFSCLDLFLRLDAFLDKRLTKGEERLVREHLEICERCLSEYRFEEGVLVHLKETLEHLPVPEGLLGRIRGELNEAKDDRGR